MKKLNALRIVSALACLSGAGLLVLSLAAFPKGAFGWSLCWIALFIGIFMMIAGMLCYEYARDRQIGVNAE